jgi:hypothetical protein
LVRRACCWGIEGLLRRDPQATRRSIGVRFTSAPTRGTRGMRVARFLRQRRAITISGSDGVATQRILKIRRDYNKWVANETMEDYALRFTPRTFRKWSSFRVANTAIGGISFLALEAIGGAITLNYGYSNAIWAIATVSLIVFATGLPISYYAARSGVDMDLLTRGAGFGYIGSTFTSLIYASFTFIFFAIEAAIMALALELYFDLPLPLGYLVSRSR